MIASDLRGLEKIIMYFETKYMNSERDKRAKINLRSNKNISHRQKKC